MFTFVEPVAAVGFGGIWTFWFERLDLEASDAQDRADPSDFIRCMVSTRADFDAVRNVS